MMRPLLLLLFISAAFSAETLIGTDYLGQALYEISPGQYRLETADGDIYGDQYVSDGTPPNHFYSVGTAEAPNIPPPSWSTTYNSGGVTLQTDGTGYRIRYSPGGAWEYGTGVDSEMGFLFVYGNYTPGGGSTPPDPTEPDSTWYPFMPGADFTIPPGTQTVQEAIDAGVLPVGILNHTSPDDYYLGGTTDTYDGYLQSGGWATASGGGGFGGTGSATVTWSRYFNGDFTIDGSQTYGPTGGDGGGFTPSGGFNAGGGNDGGGVVVNPGGGTDPGSGPDNSGSTGDGSTSAAELEALDKIAGNTEKLLTLNRDNFDYQNERLQDIQTLLSGSQAIEDAHREQNHADLVGIQAELETSNYFLNQLRQDQLNQSSQNDSNLDVIRAELGFVQDDLDAIVAAQNATTQAVNDLDLDVDVTVEGGLDPVDSDTEWQDPIITDGATVDARAATLAAGLSQNLPTEQQLAGSDNWSIDIDMPWVDGSTETFSFAPPDASDPWFSAFGLFMLTVRIFLTVLLFWAFKVAVVTTLRQY